MKRFEVIKNFFSSDDISFIKECAEEYHKNKILLNAESSNELKVYDINEKIDFDLYNIIDNKIKKEFGMEILTTRFHYFKNTSDIKWHYDDSSKCSGAATIYLNIEWERDWGGYFVYEKDGKLGIEMPEYNKCIFQSGPILHAITSVSRSASYRKSLQIFFKK